MFDWDNYFSSYIAGLDPLTKNISYSNLIQITKVLHVGLRLRLRAARSVWVLFLVSFHRGSFRFVSFRFVSFRFVSFSLV
jgi:hypothetical protein